MTTDAKTLGVAVRTVRFRLPLRLVSEANARGHWSQGHKRSKAQRAAIALAWPAFSRGAVITLPATVLITRIGPRRFDDDNNVRAAKAVRDELAKQLGVDDRDPRVRWDYAQRREGVREYAVEVVVSSEEA